MPLIGYTKQDIGIQAYPIVFCETVGEFCPIDSPIYFVDVETYKTGVYLFDRRLRLIQIFDTQVCYVVDHQMLGQIPWIQQTIASKQILKVAHNANFEYTTFKTAHYEPHNFYCTMQTEKILKSGIEIMFNLKDVVARRKIATLSKELQSSDFSGQLSIDQIVYGATDAVVLMPLYQQQYQEIQEAELLDIITNEIELVEVTCEMQLAGVCLDVEHTKNVYHKLKEENEDLLSEIQNLLPQVPLGQSYFNVKKVNGEVVEQKPKKKTLEKYPTLMKAPDTNTEFKLAYDRMGVKIPYHPKTKQPSLSKATYGLIDHPTGLMLQKYFADKKIIDAYIRPLLPAVERQESKSFDYHCPYTGRVHAEFHQNGTVTGRYAIKEPALNTLPRRDFVRRMVVAPSSEWRIVKADYSQMELRVAACYLQEPNMIQAYQDNKDLHEITATTIYSIPLGQVSKEQRQIGKNVNFGSIYGQRAKGLQEYIYKMTGLRFPIEECQLFCKSFYASWPGIEAYHKAVGDFTLKNYEKDICIKSMLNRPRHWAAYSLQVISYETKWGKRTFCMCNDVINHPIQSTVGDIIKKAQTKVYKNLQMGKYHGKLQLVLQVHDELVYYAHVSVLEQFEKDLAEAMIVVAQDVLKEVPIQVEVGHGVNWADLEMKKFSSVGLAA